MCKENNGTGNVMLPKSELTKRQLGFIGIEFDTGEGSTLTVTGVVGKSESAAIFNLACSVCSLDTELWPEGRITSVKSNLVNGSVPCGCAKSPQWTDAQYIIRIKRECEVRGYDFLGFEGKFKKVHTKLKLHNPVTGNTWNSTSITVFFEGHGDPIAGKITIPDEIHIQEFMNTGKFLEGTTFKRNLTRKDSKGKLPYWDRYCPKCSTDEYVSNGLCSGVFTSTRSSLKGGQLPCRCSKAYRWNQEQSEYRLNEILYSEGLPKLNGWETEKGYIKNSSKFYWACSKGHECKTEVKGFLQGNRCDTCAKEEKGFNGYYPNRIKEQDNLYVINFQSCIKVGRAFDVESRIGNSPSQGLLKQSGKDINQIEILTVLTGTHEEIYSLEQDIHAELRERGFEYNEETWSTELFTLDSERMIYKLLDQSGLPEGVW